MRRFGLFVVAAAVIALAASPALAQRQRPGGGGAPGMGAVSNLTLLQNKSVQDELKLSDDQVAKVKDAAQKQAAARPSLQGLQGEERAAKMRELSKEGDKLVADILKPEQTKRLKQIRLQQQGATALASPEVSKELNFTEEQKTKLKELQADARKQMQGLFQGGNREEAMKKVTEINKSTNEKAMAMLTPEQKAKWKDMTGEPFKGEIRLVPPGGRRPGGGRNDR